MDDSCLEHCLSPEEGAFFEENGFLHVKQAVGSEQLARLRQACDRVDAEHRAQQQLAPDARLNLLDFIGLDDEFLELLDCPKTFPKVWGIMGWHISLCAQISHPHPTPPTPAVTPPPA